MSWWGYALWGSFGGFWAAAVDFLRVVNATGRMPWARTRGKPACEPGAYLAAAVTRLVIGGGVAWAAAGYLTNAIQAVAVGVAAPFLVAPVAELAKRLLGRGVSS